MEYAFKSLPVIAQKRLREIHYGEYLKQDKNGLKLPLKGLNEKKVKPSDELTLFREQPRLLTRAVNSLTYGQRIIADARMALVQEVVMLEAVGQTALCLESIKAFSGLLLDS